MEIKDMICPKCFGTGISMVYLTLNMPMPCSYCGGTGRIKITNSINVSEEQKTPLKEAN